MYAKLGEHSKIIHIVNPGKGLTLCGQPLKGMRESNAPKLRTHEQCCISCELVEEQQYIQARHPKAVSLDSLPVLAIISAPYFPKENT